MLLHVYLSCHTIRKTTVDIAGYSVVTPILVECDKPTIVFCSCSLGASRKLKIPRWNCKEQQPIVYMPTVMSEQYFSRVLIGQPLADQQSAIHLRAAKARKWPPLLFLGRNLFRKNEEASCIEERKKLNNLWLKNIQRHVIYLFKHICRKAKTGIVIW